MGFTKDEATAAIRQITKGAERGALLTFLGMNEEVLQSQLVSSEDGSEAIVACVQTLQMQQNQGEQRCAMHGEIVTSQDNQTSPMHTHQDHSLLCLISSLLSLSSSLSMLDASASMPSCSRRDILVTTRF